MTLGALLAIRELELKIPDDVSVVGFDDMEWAPLADPPLTALAQPTYEMGVEAVGMLLERMDGDEEVPPRRKLLEPHLVVRSSTAPPQKRT
jgi:DNA-binding LacI/PurR family transcriptional regulator